GPATEHMAQPVKNISLDQVGCEARKIPAEGDVFFLDFYLYRTNQELATTLKLFALRIRCGLLTAVQRKRGGMQFRC
ncbi:MAG: hypothetical protein WBY69_16045, partial [Candidatus Acidiferrales bacterium]